jgi:hypothetical protein
MLCLDMRFRGFQRPFDDFSDNNKHCCQVPAMTGLFLIQSGLTSINIEFVDLKITDRPVSVYNLWNA